MRLTQVGLSARSSKVFGVLVVGCAAALVAVQAAAAGALTFSDKVGSKTSVSVTVHTPAAFTITMRAPTSGRTQLFLLGKKAPKGGPLLDTASTSCEGGAGSLVCKGSYEPLPPGTYTFRIVRRSGTSANVQLRVRW